MQKLDPTDIAFYSQPLEDAAKWHGRGFTVAVKAERRLTGPSGQLTPTVSIDAWDKGMIAGGITKLIREPLDNPKDDIGNPNLLYWLYPQDEPDNKEVEDQDNHRDWMKDYADVEQWCAQMRAIDPTRPLAVNVGVEQFRYSGKIDGVRLLKPFDVVICDYYGILRGYTVAETLTIIKTFRDAYAGSKLVMWFVEATNQNLSYGSRRLLTTDELAALLDGCHAMGLVPGIFSQVIGSAPTATAPGVDFLYDGIDAAHVATIGAHLAKVRGNAPPVQPPVPTPGKTVVRVVTVTIYGDGSSEVTSK